jgi:hypothetical protein
VANWRAYRDNKYWYALFEGLSEADRRALIARHFEDLAASPGLATWMRLADNGQPLTEASLGQRLRAWGALDGTGLGHNLEWLQQVNRWFSVSSSSIRLEKISGVVYFSTGELDKFAKIENGRLIFRYSGFGRDIVLNPQRATTGLGKFREVWSDPNSNGTWLFLGEPGVKPGLPDGIINRVTSGVPHKNSLGFLDLPGDDYNHLMNKHIKVEFVSRYGDSYDLSSITNQSQDIVKEIIKNDIIPDIDDTDLQSIINIGINNGKNEFWDLYNYPFLKAAFERGDDIRLLSDPSIFGASLDIGGFYKRELDAITMPYGLAQVYGYSYDVTRRMYIKN